MITPLSSAGIILSYKCNSRCRHCLYCCSPQWKDWMGVDLLKAIYEGTLASARSRRGFHLAGGEAFLNFPLLLQAVELASHYGIPLDYVETNAGWFTDEESAVEKLTQLRDAGLSCLLVSASPFHAEHIPVGKTLGAIRASLRVFGQYGTMVWLPEFLRELTRITDTDTLAFEEYVEAVGLRQARSAAEYGGQLIPGGRSGSTLAHLLPQRPKEAFFGSDCSYELLRSGRGHFDPYGNIITGVCSGISVGDSHDLVSAYRDFRLADHPIIETLCTRGVEGLYEMASTVYGYVARDSYSGQCHLCMDIRRHLVAAGAEYPELAPKEFYAQV